VQDRKNLYIIGASNLGREMESWLQTIPEANRDWIFKGFIHTYDKKSPLEGYPSDYLILGGWENFPFSRNDYCIISVADTDWKEKIYNHLKNKVNFFTFISPNAIIGKFNNIGEGCIICPNCIVTTNVTLGKLTTLNIGTQIGHDSVIGDFSSLMTSIEIGGQVAIGKKVFIGSHATIIPKIKIEDCSFIGAGSVVITKVKKGTTVFGNPAKIINET
jgi:sugar O-acyltransferase (sialic acid O-acetyltransferase NeuD family)